MARIGENLYAQIDSVFDAYKARLHHLPLPPWIGALAFVPAALAWAPAMRRTVEISDVGVLGLTGRRLLRWSGRASADVVDGVPVLLPRKSTTELRGGMGHFFR